MPTTESIRSISPKTLALENPSGTFRNGPNAHIDGHCVFSTNLGFGQEALRDAKMIDSCCFTFVTIDCPLTCVSLSTSDQHHRISSILRLPYAICSKPVSLKKRQTSNQGSVPCVILQMLSPKARQGFHTSRTYRNAVPERTQNLHVVQLAISLISSLLIYSRQPSTRSRLLPTPSTFPFSAKLLSLE